MSDRDFFTCEHYPTEYQHRYNHLPFPLRPLTEEQFARSVFFISAPQHTEYRQAHFAPKDLSEEVASVLSFRDNKQKVCMVSVRLFWFDAHSGIAVINDYWGGKVHWFEFGCKHEWEHTGSPYRCYHEYVCRKCGVKNAVDSSD